MGLGVQKEKGQRADHKGPCKKRGAETQTTFSELTQLQRKAESWAAICRERKSVGTYSMYKSMQAGDSI